jgi:hypothetical protein
MEMWYELFNIVYTSSVQTGIRAPPEEYVIFLRIVHLLLVTDNAVTSAPSLVFLMMGALRSSETSVLTRDAWCNVPGDGILHSHRRQNLKSYRALTGWTL